MLRKMVSKKKPDISAAVFLALLFWDTCEHQLIGFINPLFYPVVV